MEHNHDIKPDDELQLNNFTKITDNKSEHEHSEDDGHDHGGEESAGWKAHCDLLLALAILAILLTLEYGFKISLLNTLSLIVNAIAWLLAGSKVADLAFRKLKCGGGF